jgi:hypothetical protein
VHTDFQIISSGTAGAAALPPATGRPAWQIRAE